MAETVLVLAYVARASRRGCAQLGVGSRISNPAQLMRACGRTLRSALVLGLPGPCAQKQPGSWIRITHLSGGDFFQLLLVTLRPK
ncbi:unnamed protein product [Prunus armeniaca]|uniref:Uncharacterized protein n=1 Tax=Prunus armeniaca TaxID=36596 RepID=A0A6J5XSI3_PRUAR|nr:unnamed protein product [Prunus armeniaca]